MPNCVSQEFTESLHGFQKSFVSESQRRRQVFLRHRQIIAEIEWCRKDIRRLEREGRRRPSVHRLIAQRVHDIRHKEIEIAFLDAPTELRG